jgi:membrane associated rhomboid family serine protease
MFPIKDDIPSRDFPTVTVGLIVINTIVFIFELSMGRTARMSFVADFGLVPENVTAFFGGTGMAAGRVFLPFFTAMFLHGGWFHLIGNMWYLWIFGDNIEDRLGHGRFLIFFLVCGLVGNAVHYLFNVSSQLPTIGASGAVAGVLGAYLISYPGARILVLFPLFFLIQFIELPALIVLGFWFVLQFLNGAASIVMASDTGGVAWLAHVGGFVSGIMIFKILRPRPKVWYFREQVEDSY